MGAPGCALLQLGLKLLDWEHNLGGKNMAMECEITATAYVRISCVSGHCGAFSVHSAWRHLASGALCYDTRIASSFALGNNENMHTVEHILKVRSLVSGNHARYAGRTLLRAQQCDQGTAIEYLFGCCELSRLWMMIDRMPAASAMCWEIAADG